MQIDHISAHGTLLHVSHYRVPYTIPAHLVSILVCCMLMLLFL